MCEQAGSGIIRVALASHVLSNRVSLRVGCPSYHATQQSSRRTPSSAPPRATCCSTASLWPSGRELRRAWRRSYSGPRSTCRWGWWPGGRVSVFRGGGQGGWLLVLVWGRVRARVLLLTHGTAYAVTSTLHPCTPSTTRRGSTPSQPLTPDPYRTRLRPPRSRRRRVRPSSRTWRGWPRAASRGGEGQVRGPGGGVWVWVCVGGWVGVGGWGAGLDCMGRGWRAGQGGGVLGHGPV